MNDQTREQSGTGSVDTAIDRVVDDMTQVRMSDDAVTRVMARVRGAKQEPEPETTPGSWAALVLPRLAWSAAPVAAMLALIIVAVAAWNVSQTWQPREGAPAATTVARAGADMPLAVEAPAAAPRTVAAAPRAVQPSPSQASRAAEFAAGERVAATSVVAGDEEKPSQSKPQASVVPAPAAKASAQNVKLEITVTDHAASATAGAGAAAGAAKPVSKMLDMVVADREYGSIKSSSRGNAPPSVLEVVARPEILEGGRIKVKLSLTYRPGAPEQAEAGIEKSIVAVLNDGAPTVVSESADAASDRRVTVEVKATIQK